MVGLTQCWIETGGKGRKRWGLQGFRGGTNAAIVGGMTNEPRYEVTVITPKGSNVHYDCTQARVNAIISEWSEWLEQCPRVDLRIEVKPIKDAR